MCDELYINSFNIENFKNELEEVYSHDPYTEVNCYFTQLVELFLLSFMTYTFIIFSHVSFLFFVYLEVVYFLPTYLSRYRNVLIPRQSLNVS